VIRKNYCGKGSVTLLLTGCLTRYVINYTCIDTLSVFVIDVLLLHAKKVIWRCDQKTLNCHGRLHVGPDETVLQELPHDRHFPDAARINALIVKHRLKTAAKETRDDPQVIISQVTSTSSDATIARLPKVRSMKRDIRVTRQILTCGNGVRLPANLSEINLPEELKKTTKGECFLLHDSGPETGSNRFLVFGTENFLKHMVSCDEIFCDGTFKLPPNLFCQLYIMHGFDGEKYVPCIYALLPNKSKPMYAALLNALIEKSNHKFKPKTVMSDFEAGFINAVQETFPEAVCKGCFFHLSQSIMRHVQKEEEVYSNYSLDDAYATDVILFPLNF